MNQKFNRALIFINGDEKDLAYTEQYLDKNTLLIGCDGGTDKIYELGLKPYAVIGDFDSIKSLPGEIRNLPTVKYGKEVSIDGVTYIKYPRDKDFLDVELALDYAANKKIKEIILVNTNGDELDHVLGTLIILARHKYIDLDIKAVSLRHKIYIAQKETIITGNNSDKISLIPLYGGVEVKSSTGLKYDPAKYQMSLQNNIGISNELTNKKATLDISKGCFLVIQHY